MIHSVDVLHVDDEPGFADTVAEFVEGEDDRINVETVRNADDGLDILSREEYDCVVSDYEMPGMDGIEFLEAVRRRYPDMPFVLFTGRGNEKVASEAISKGVTDYLQKDGGTEQYKLLAKRIVNAAEKYAAEKEADWHRAVIRNMEEGVYVLDEDYSHRFVNFRVQMDGMREEQWMEKNLSVLVNENVVSSSEEQRIKQEIDRVFAGETDEARVVIEPKLPVEEDEVEVRLTKIEAGSGEDLVLGTTRDITERKKRSRELKRYEAMVENSSDLMTHLDDDGTILYHSPALERILGYDQEALVGDSSFDYVHPEDRGRALENFESLLNGSSDIVEGVEARFKRKDGSYVWLEMTGSDQRDTEVGGVVINARDITERKEYERKLERRSEAMETSAEGIAITDSDGEYIYVNESHADIYGYDKAGDLLGETWRMLYDEEETERLDSEVMPVVKEEGEWRGEATGLRADGTKFPQQVSLTRLDDGSSICVVRDITERKERERELKRQNRRLEEFASILGHDLRNPLNVAMGQIELARRDCENEHLDKASGALERIDALIDGVLTLAREGQIGQKEPVSLRKLAEDCWRDVSTSEATFVPEKDTTVRAHKTSFRQFMENILQNAIEHGGDDVTVTVGELKNSEGFYVSDDGPGIPEDEGKRVFERGYSTSENGDSFGLGLFIVGEIAEAHGWDVNVTESEDGGARFEISGIESV